MAKTVGLIVPCEPETEQEPEMVPETEQEPEETTEPPKRGKK